MPNVLNVKAGQRFGRLTVICEIAQIDGRRAFKFKCDCGKATTKTLISVATGHTRSCGCLFLETLGNARTHGRSRTPIYKIWTDMLKRCRNPHCKSYPNYGGRGIKVAKRWHTFENFLADMGERPSDKHELDRINHNGDYKPSNVQWTASNRWQNINRSKPKNTSSKFRGVDLWAGRKWRARINVKNKAARHLGLFNTEIEAARAYDAVARRHKDFPLNFPKSKQELTR